MGSGNDRVGNPTQGQSNQGLGSGSSFYWGNDLLGMAVNTRLYQIVTEDQTGSAHETSGAHTTPFCH